MPLIIKYIFLAPTKEPKESQSSFVRPSVVSLSRAINLHLSDSNSS